MNAGIARAQQRVGEPLERGVRGAGRGVHARRPAEVELGFRIEDVARQADEHRAGGWRHGHLRRAPHDARQILHARHLHGPLHHRLRDRHQRVVEHRLLQAMALLLLPGGDQHRRAVELGVVERAHRVAQPGRDVHVAGGEPVGCARIAVRHADHQRLLQTQHVLDLRLLPERLHDRQLGGAGIAEHDVDAFGGEQRQECGAAGQVGAGREISGAARIVHGGRLGSRKTQFSRSAPHALRRRGTKKAPLSSVTNPRTRT